MPTLTERKRPKYIPPRKPFERRHVQVVDIAFNYNSTRWRKDRKAHLNACMWVCAICRGAASVSDHITPIRQGGDAWDWSNRQALCNTCHNKKSGSEAHPTHKRRGIGGINL